MTPTHLKEVWVYLSATPLLWLTVTLLAYQLAHALYTRAKLNPLLNPVAITIAILLCLLAATHTPYDTYFEGAQFVHFLLGPAVVALAIPLYEQFERLRAWFWPIAFALVIGTVTAVVSAVGVAWLLGASRITLLSMVPKSITAPIAMGISEKIGGLPQFTAVLVVITGIIGAISVRYVLDTLRIRDYSVRGFALGIAAHGIGTARAFQVSEEAGAFAGLAFGLHGLFASVMFPLVFWLIGKA